MAEIMLGVVVVALLAERAWTQRTHVRYQQRLLNIIEAKNTAELVVLNRIDEQPPAPKAEPEPPRRLQHPVGL